MNLSHAVLGCTSDITNLKIEDSGDVSFDFSLMVEDEYDIQNFSANLRYQYDEDEDYNGKTVWDLVLKSLEIKNDVMKYVTLSDETEKLILDYIEQEICVKYPTPAK